MYKVTFKLNGRQTGLSNLVYNSYAKCSFSEDEIIEKMVNVSPTQEMINIATQVLRKYSTATEIYVTEMKEQEQKKQGDSGAGGIIMLFAFLIAVLLAPIIITLGMHGKFLLKGLYKNVLDNQKFKKFRKPYCIVGFIFLGLCAVAVAVGAIINVEALLTGGLYALFIGNIVYFIVGCIIGNKIYKEQVK